MGCDQHERAGESKPSGPGKLASPAAARARADCAAAIRAGEPATLRAVVERYLRQILRAARGAGLSPQDAEEVTQETFTTFLEIAPRFEGRSHVRTFLFGILYRKIAELRRDFSHQRQHDPIDEVMEARFATNGTWRRPPAADGGACARRVSRNPE